MFDTEEERQHLMLVTNRLNELSNDFIQIYLGANIENAEERRQEFIQLHNELRSLLGKDERHYK